MSSIAILSPSGGTRSAPAVMARDDEKPIELTGESIFSWPISAAAATSTSSLQARYGQGR
jgi:hypothetical protein